MAALAVVALIPLLATAAGTPAAGEAGLEAPAALHVTRQFERVGRSAIVFGAL